MIRRLSVLLVTLGLLTGGGQAQETDLTRGFIGGNYLVAPGAEYASLSYVAAGGPLAQAGVEKGDLITSINGVSTRGVPLASIRRLMGGKIGDGIRLTIRHPGSSTDLPVAIVRESAFEAYEPAADQGDDRAQCQLGAFYESGPIVTRDMALAVAWYEKSASQGYAPAEARLGYLFHRGLGVPKDDGAAAAWFLKSARQGNAFAERDLGLSYMNGWGVPFSDRDAFAWFYSAARQDDRTAQQYLAFFYKTGRGTPQDDRAAFAWYYRSAVLGDAYGEWGLGYMYENGRGTKASATQALKWYRLAQATLPDNVNLRKDVDLVSLKAFLEDPATTPLNLAPLMRSFRPQVLGLLAVLGLIYLAGGGVLFYFTFGATASTSRLAIALGWVAFYLESQGVALLALFVLGTSLTANALLGATSLFSAFPVIASSFGSLQNRIWKESSVSWKTLLLYGLGAGLVLFVADQAYDKIYTFLAHAPLPSQPTQILIDKAKGQSIWLSFACVAVALPLAEEIIFRGYLFDALRQRFSGHGPVILTALAFSVVHFQALYFVPLFIFGLILGRLRQKTDSLRLPMLLHVLNNGLFLFWAP